MKNRSSDLLAVILTIIAILAAFTIESINSPRARFYIGYTESKDSARIVVNACRNIATNVTILISSPYDINTVNVVLEPPYEKVNILEKNQNSVLAQVSRLNALPFFPHSLEHRRGLNFYLTFQGNKIEAPLVSYVVATADNGGDYISLPQSQLAEIVQVFWKCWPVIEILGIAFLFIMFRSLLKYLATT